PAAENQRTISASASAGAGGYSGRTAAAGAGGAAGGGAGAPIGAQPDSNRPNDSPAIAAQGRTGRMDGKVEEPRSRRNRTARLRCGNGAMNNKRHLRS